MGTGLRERMETLVMAGVVSMECRTPEPTRPVAPVRMRCIVSCVVFSMDFKLKDGSHEHNEKKREE